MSDPNTPDPRPPDPNAPAPSTPDRSSFRLPGPSRAGASIHFNWRRTKITSMKVIKLTFKTDHHLMTDNNTDWKNTGSPFPKPEWTYGKASSPVSNTKNQNIDVDVDFEVNPPNAGETDADVTGTAAFGSLVLTAPKQKFKGGVITISARSTGPLPDKVVKLTGDIDWAVSTVEDGPFGAGASWGHTMYITINMPISVSGPEAGITQKRMDKAVELIGAIGSLDPHAIVTALMTKIPYYTLERDPAVPSEFNHPQFFNSVGGAWPINDFLGSYAECQAIVRWVKAVIGQVGCPGTSEGVVVWASPDDGGVTVREDPLGPTGTTTLHGMSKTIHGRSCRVALAALDPVSVGSTFTPGSMMNMYEACLKFTNGGTTKYYGGGLGGAGLDTKEQVIKAFYALVWYSASIQPDGSVKYRIEEIVRRFR